MKSLRRVWAAAQRIPFAQHIKIGNQEAERYLILTRLLKTDEAMRLAPSGIASLPDYFQYKGYAGLPTRETRIETQSVSYDFRFPSR